MYMAFQQTLYDTMVKPRFDQYRCNNENDTITELLHTIESSLKQGYLRYAGNEVPERIVRRLYDDILCKFQDKQGYICLTHFFFPGGANRDILDEIFIVFWQFVRACDSESPTAPYYWGYNRIGRYAPRELFVIEKETWQGAELDYR
jgi:hypothetical protein